MKLSEIVEELTRKKSDGSRLYTQTTLGEAVGSNQSGVSQMLAGRVWDDHWEIFLRLLPIAVRHGLATNPVPNPAQELKRVGLQKEITHEAIDQTARGAQSARKRFSKK